VTDASQKDKAKWPLGLVIAANAVVFYWVVRSKALAPETLLGLNVDPERAIPAGLALLVATALNGLMPVDTKYRIVFLRWSNVLPSYYAFTFYAKRDPRVDLARLEKVSGGPLPVDPAQQHRLWYRAYKSVQDTPAVAQVNRDFLLMRDWTAFAVLMLLLGLPAGLYVAESTSFGATYSGALLLQYLLVRHSTATYGERMVNNVLAEVAARGAPL
jgi:hypothetical protein